MHRTLQITAVVLVGFSMALSAQEEPEPSLGDLARAVRKSRPVISDHVVVDNDNFAIVMDKAESARLNGEPIFSIDPSGSTFRMTSPDGTCSLSFDAKSSSPGPAAYATTDLPQDELLKLEGPATVRDSALQIYLHNGTGWELKEVVVGITVLQSAPAPTVQKASLVEPIDGPPPVKLPDTTVLYHLKGNAAPESTSVFSANVDPGFPATADWHWSIIGARGIPPASNVDLRQGTTPAQPGPPVLSVPSPQTSEQTPPVVTPSETREK